MKNILEYLEETARRVPEKTAFVCDEERITFSRLRKRAAEYGMQIARKAGFQRRRPICVIGERDIQTLICMLACVYSGNFYVPVDAGLPKARMDRMLQAVDFIGVVSCTGTHYGNEKFLFSDVCTGDRPENPQTEAGACFIPTEEELDAFAAEQIAGSCSFDPLYGIFTSGTTGEPKLVVKSHAAMAGFMDVFVNMFGFEETDILGNQVPFYFDASTKDLFSCLKCGLTVHIIPKKYFSFPRLLIRYLIDRKISKIIWVPSALCLVANTDSLQAFGIPQSLKKVFFVGEQMPVRQLNYWKKMMPEVQFVNLYGTTETAGNFLYYIYDRILEDDQRLPTGRAFPDTRVFLLREDGTEIREPGETGEICAVSNTLSLGYYGSPEMTRQAFVQNPSVPYRETMYRTGDLAFYDAEGNIVWTSRRDFQIKHMGYRIELSDIETTLGAVPEIEECCCTYDEEKKKILFYYQAGKDLKKEIGKQVRAKLPKYMFPSKYILLESMPHNANGKIDRRKLVDG